MSIVEDGQIMASGRVSDVFASEPEALLRLTGHPVIHVPPEKACFKITLESHKMTISFLSKLAATLQNGYDLLYVATDICGDERIGHFYIAVDETASEKAGAWLRSESVVFSQMTSSQSFKTQKNNKQDRKE
jgi:ABC-type methionine transport system ATPase subunit